mgnify:CR=1 FL=1
MTALYRNWLVHNLLGHPLSELIFWLVRPFVGLARAENISGEVHDLTIPAHVQGTGRG